MAIDSNFRYLKDYKQFIDIHKNLLLPISQVSMDFNRFSIVAKNIIFISNMNNYKRLEGPLQTTGA